MIPSILPTYNRAPLAFVKGEGSWLVAEDGTRYLDLGAGIAVNALGHAHPDLVAALTEQAHKLWHVSNVLTNEPALNLARRLCELTFAQRVFFAHSGAVHASATVLTAFLRPFMLRLLKPAAGYQPEDRPSVSSLGFMWFFTYCSVLIFIHHLWLFIAESFSFTQFIFVIQKIAVSSVVSIAIILSLQYLFYRRRARAIV